MEDWNFTISLLQDFFVHNKLNCDFISNFKNTINIFNSWISGLNEATLLVYIFRRRNSVAWVHTPKSSANFKLSILVLSFPLLKQRYTFRGNEFLNHSQWFNLILVYVLIWLALSSEIFSSKFLFSAEKTSCHYLLLELNSTLMCSMIKKR